MPELFDQDDGDSWQESSGLRYLLAAVTLVFAVPALLLAEPGSVFQVLFALAVFVLPLIVLRWGVAGFFAVLGLVIPSLVIAAGTCIARFSKGI